MNSVKSKCSAFIFKAQKNGLPLCEFLRILTNKKPGK